MTDYYDTQESKKSPHEPFPSGATLRDRISLYTLLNNQLGRNGDDRFIEQLLRYIRLAANTTYRFSEQAETTHETIRRNKDNSQSGCGI